MPISHPFPRGVAAAAAFLFLLVAAAPTRAAVIASFDPAFGGVGPTANLGFRGNIYLDVSNGCYAQTGYHAVGGSCSVTPEMAHIDFYNATTDPSATQPPLAQVDIYYPFGFPPNYVSAVYIDPLTDQLAGFDTSPSEPFYFTAMDNTGDPLTSVNYNGTMTLFFQSGFAGLVSGIHSFSLVSSPSGSSQVGIGGAYLRNCTGQSANSSCVGTPSLPGTLQFTNTAVPEPDSIALAALGLGVLAISRRRKSIVR